MRPHIVCCTGAVVREPMKCSFNKTEWTEIMRLQDYAMSVCRGFFGEEIKRTPAPLSYRTRAQGQEPPLGICRSGSDRVLRHRGHPLVTATLSAPDDTSVGVIATGA